MDSKLVTDQTAFEVICLKPHGPIRKFELLKRFHHLLPQEEIGCPARELSSAEITAEIAKRLNS